MADISDVARALQAAVQAIRTASFPTATVLYGWPSSAQFAAATRAPLVTVWQRPGYFRNTTRYPRTELLGTATPPSLTASTAGNVATFSGTCSADQIAGLRVGTTAWAVRCDAGSTPSTIAAALAALSGGTAAGSSVTLAGLTEAATARDVPAYTVTRQQEVQFCIIVWTADPDVRDAIASAIDAVLSDTEFLTMPDGTAARLTWVGSTPSDRAQNSDLYRRDLFYMADFSTTRAAARTPVLFPGATFAPGSLRLGALHP